MTQHAIRDRQSAGLDGFVCCSIGDEQYAMRGADVRNVARADLMTPLMDGDGRVGTLRDGAAAIPVYSLAALFGRKVPFRSGDGHIVVTGGAGGSFGLMVDRIVRATAQRSDDVLPLPEFVGRQAASWFDGLLRLDDTALLVLAPAGLDAVAPSTAMRQTAARACRRAAAEHAGSSDMVVTFSSAALPHSGTRRYALSGRRVAALVQSLPSIPLPGRSPHVKALAWWQKAAVPVLEFADGSIGPNGATRFLVARCGGRDAGFVAFRVDADVSLHRATAEDGRVAGRDGLPFLRGVFNVSGECVGLLDLDALAAGVAAPPAAAVSVPVLI